MSLTEKQISQVEALAASLSIGQIADYFGFSEDEFCELERQDTKVLKAYNKGRSKGIKEVVELLWVKMQEGNIEAITFYLEHMIVKKLEISFADKSPMGLFNSGLKALEEGKINLTQMEQLANCALIKMKIENSISVEEKLKLN